MLKVTLLSQVGGNPLHSLVFERPHVRIEFFPETPNPGLHLYVALVKWTNGAVVSGVKLI